MTTRFDSAVKTAEWLGTAELTAVVDRIETAEHYAFLWHVVALHMAPQDRERIESLASDLRAGGWSPEAAAAAPPKPPSFLDRLPGRTPRTNPAE